MNDRDKLLTLAREQLGTAEQPPGSNNVIYNADYYGGPVSGPQYPWCCAFVWWLFWKAGLSALFCGGEKTAYCPYVVHWARTHGRWVTGGCRPGDLLLYDWDGDGVADHIGICENVSSDGTLTAIEGNCENAVRRVTRWHGSVMGAVRPAYGDAKTETPAESGMPGAAAPADTAESDGEGLPDTYTVRSGDMLGLIALRYGTTIRELARINGIRDADMIYPGQVLRLRETAEVSGTPRAASPTYAAGDAQPDDDLAALARAVIRGEYGNGLVRRLRLGRDYERVQAEVNRLLSGRERQ